MEGHHRPIQKQERHFPWTRAIVAFLISLLIAAATLLTLLNTGHVIAGYWLAIIPIIFSAIGLIIPLGQWLFPISTDRQTDSPPLLPTPIEVKISLSPSITESAIQNDQIKKSTGIWNVPYRRNPYFTGREDVLHALHDRLNNSTTTLIQSQAINGLSGVGKTQTAVEYAYRHRPEYHSVCWVTATTRDSIIASFLDLAALLELPEQHEPDQHIVLAAVNRWLMKQKQCLFIFDDADDLTLAEEFFPPGESGHLLLTTRNQAPGTLAQSFEIDPMNAQEGTLFMLRRAKLLAGDSTLEQALAEDRTHAEQIVEAMDGLPLALDQAAAYIEETQCTLVAFLEKYQRQRDEVLRRRGGAGRYHPLPVAATWSLSFTQVQQMNPTAADLLRVSSFLSPDAIPEELLMDGAAELGPSITKVKNDPTQLDEAIATLNRFSLMRRNRENHTISLHRLVQTALLIDMDGPTKKRWAERTVRAVSATFPTGEVVTWPQCERLLSHALKCAILIDEYSFTLQEAAYLLNQVASYLHDRAQYEQAEPLLNRALAIREQILGPNHPHTAQSLNNLAELYRSQGKYEQAEPLLNRAFTIYEQVLGPDHPNTASSLNNLALLYKNQRKYEQAEPLNQRALAICEQVLGPLHADTASSLNNLAFLYHTQEKYEQAEPLYQRALAIKEQVLGPNHPATATSLNNLAVLYRSQGKHEQAEPFYQRALAIKEQTLGPDHPNTAISLNNLAELYRSQGKYEQAEPLLKRALTIYEQVLGPDHPNTFIIRNNYQTLLQNTK